MNGLTFLDYAVMAVYLAVIAAMGVYFARRQHSTEVYFVGGRSIPWWAMGLSMLATLISSITFIAYPGAAYDKDWSLLVPGLMVVVVMALLVVFIVPFYRQVVGMSAYEYFEKRFGYGARVYSSLAFMMIHFTKMGFVFYLLALALSSMTGWNIYALLAILGTITVIYTLLGGIEAVIWSDVIQGIVLSIGGIACLLVLLFTPEAGPAAVVSHAWENDKIGLGDFSFDFSQGTVIVLAIYGFTTYVQKYSADQTIVQRYLVAKSHGEAIRGTILGTLLCIPVWTMFMFIGSCLWSFYDMTGDTLPESITKSDQVFPYFVMNNLPPGLTGMILAALTAAAMSTLDSDLNCLGAVVVEDYYRRWFPDADDRMRLNVGRMVIVAAGFASVCLAMVLAETEGTALSLGFLITAIVSGGIAGLFALAFLSQRANTGGVYVGIAACVLFTAWATLTSKQQVDWGRFNFPLHRYMIAVLANVVLFVVGYAASFFFASKQDTREMTLWGWRERRLQYADLATQSEAGKS